MGMEESEMPVYRALPLSPVLWTQGAYEGYREEKGGYFS